MSRLLQIQPALHEGLSHTSGSESRRHIFVRNLQQFIPRVWEWIDLLALDKQNKLIYPTCVGITNIAHNVKKQWFVWSHCFFSDNVYAKTRAVFCSFYSCISVWNGTPWTWTKNRPVMSRMLWPVELVFQNSGYWKPEYLCRTSAIAIRSVFVSCPALALWYHLVSTEPVGFEPTRWGIKILCLTAWRWPYYVYLMGFKPTTNGLKVRCSTIEHSVLHLYNFLINLIPFNAFSTVNSFF